jgi:GAF domain-containing protein
MSSPGEPDCATLRTDRGCFAETDVALLRSFVGQASIALENARL